MNVILLMAFLAGGALLTLGLLAMPVVGSMLLRSLQAYPPLSKSAMARETGAIIVMGGDLNRHAPEYGGETVGRLTLERLRMAARLHCSTRAPVLVTGGRPPRAATSLGELMRDVLERDFAVPVRWVETEARDTRQNALLSAAILRAEGIEDVLLVTHAWHMRRAMIAFGGTGLRCTPVPLGTFRRPTPIWVDFRPCMSGLQQSLWALHERRSILGMRLFGGASGRRVGSQRGPA